MSAAPNMAAQKVIYESILWRGSFQPGHEACRLYSQEGQWHLEGAAVFTGDGLPCRLDYHITCTRDWRTRSVEVSGWLGHTSVGMHIAVTPEQHWLLDGVDQLPLTGCTDIDLNFSPSTNMLPIRRLNLAVGAAAQVKAAWLRFPSFRLEPLEQVYTRVGEMTYRYESAGGKFVTELKVNPTGFVVDYPDFWKEEVIYEDQSEDR